MRTEQSAWLLRCWSSSIYSILTAEDSESLRAAAASAAISLAEADEYPAHQGTQYRGVDSPQTTARRSARPPAAFGARRRRDRGLPYVHSIPTSSRFILLL